MQEETTMFAPAGRASNQELKEQHNLVFMTSLLMAVLDTVPDMMLVLNEHRQIVAVNNQLLSSFGIADQTALLGMRPGEAVSCIHSSEGPNGCGTSEACSVCGAVLTILASQSTGKQADGECFIVISKDGGSALDLQVTATPLEVTGIPLTIFVLKDIASIKRRQVLERTFFHDVLNTVGGIKGIADILHDNENLDPEMEIEYKGFMVDLSESLIEEINQQRRLLSAERGEYIPELEETNIKEMLQEVCRLYGNHTRTPDRTVSISEVPVCYLKTDRSMLRRIVGNMVLNALEATPAGGTVNISLVVVATEVCIRVSNIGEIPKEVQLSLFKRSFSTKSATGRGIGTYSMKLFGERYLGGRVGFESHNGVTVFFITLPK